MSFSTPPPHPLSASLLYHFQLQYELEHVNGETPLRIKLHRPPRRKIAVCTGFGVQQNELGAGKLPLHTRACNRLPYFMVLKLKS